MSKFCRSCEGRGWHVGECHPREECGACCGLGIETLTHFAPGDRVRVHAVGREGEIRLAPPRLGTVRRLLIRDRSAWVELDRRDDVAGVHPFESDDIARSKTCLTWPEFCEAAS